MKAKTILLPALWATGLSAFAACIGPDALRSEAAAHPSAETYMALGEWFGKQNQFDCAAEAFHSGLTVDPGSPRLQYLLGLSLYSSGHAYEAANPLQTSVRLDPGVLKPHLLLGDVLQELKRTSEAEAQWQAALKVDPHSTIALDSLSNALTDGGDSSAAIALLRSVPRDEDLTLDLARAYGTGGMLEDAASTLRAALQETPDSLRLRNALVTVYVHQQRYQDGATLIEQYLAEHPGDTTAQTLYLRILVLNQDNATARPLGRKLLVAMPHDLDVLYLNGILEREAGEYAAARDHLAEAVALNPNDGSSRYNLGSALAHLGDSKGARTQLEKSIALDDSQSEAHFELASVLRALGDTQGAQEQLKIYQQQIHTSRSLAEASTNAQLAAQKFDAGDVAQAVDLYRQAVAANPQNALLSYKFAMALDRSGDTAAEQAELEQSVKLDPTLALAQNQLGYLASRQGRQATAEERFRLAVKAAPEFTQAWINLAATLSAQGRFADARGAIGSALNLDPGNAQALQVNQALARAVDPASTAPVQH